MANSCERRSALLRSLADAHFLPPEAQVVRLGAAAGLTVPQTEEARLHTRNLYSEQIDEFAKEYWSLTPDERRRRWQELAVESWGGPGVRHLRHLEAGLSVESDANVADSQVAELAAILRELFALRPRVRTARRWEWLVERDPTTNWHDVARTLRDRDEATARLDPPLLDALGVFARLPGSETSEQAEQLPPVVSASYTVTSPRFEVASPPTSSRLFGLYTIPADAGVQARLPAVNQGDEEATPRSARHIWIAGGIVIALLVFINCINGLKIPRRPQPAMPTYIPFDLGRSRPQQFTSGRTDGMIGLPMPTASLLPTTARPAPSGGKP